MIVDTEKVINICLEYTEDVYIGPNIVNIEKSLDKEPGEAFSPVKIRRSEHELTSVFLYESVVAVKMRSDYLSDLGNKLAKFRLVVKQCVSNREGECVVKFIQLSDDDLDDLESSKF